MAVTQRVRFEILKRDNHTCQYCGATAPDVQIQVDHVIPVALGGTDSPDNLVAACKSCNAGKASVQPDAPLVKAVGALSALYALEVTDKMTQIRARLEDEAEYVFAFEEAWNVWGYDDPRGARVNMPLPAEYRESIRRFRRMGVPSALIEYAIEIAMVAKGVTRPDVFRYMCGVIYRTIENQDATYPLSSETAKVYTEAEADEQRTDGWRAGYQAALDRAAGGEPGEKTYTQSEVDLLVRDAWGEGLDAGTDIGSDEWKARGTKSAEQTGEDNGQA